MRKSIIAAALALVVATGATATPASAQESTAEGVSQAFISGSSLPDSYNPVDLIQRELAGWEKMSSGDPDLSAQGSAESLSVWLLVFAAVTVVGQIVQAVSRAVAF